MRTIIAYIILGMTALFVSCEPTLKTECSSLGLSNTQKNKNKLFLTFYSGMTPTDFKSEEEKLVKDGTLYHSDSTTHFQIVVKNVADTSNPTDSADECLFLLKPSFDNCALNSISLRYIPITNVITHFKSFEMDNRNFETQQIPRESTVQAIKKLYDEKYGKSEKGGKLSSTYNSQLWHTWNTESNEITLYENYSIAQDGITQKDYPLISGFDIEYMSKEYIAKTQSRIKSFDEKQMKDSQKKIEASKKVI